MIGGPLHWRRMPRIIHAKSTGKTSLADIGNALFSPNPRQRLGHASLPIALDEQEAENDQRKLQAVIKLARQASSGDVILRGGADHQGAAFTARSCFLFQSIVIPALQAQDVSRMAILELEPLPRPGEPGAVDLPPLVPKRFAAIGAALRRRLLQGWPRWRVTVEAYAAALTRAGHGARGADQFGTLLAAADLLLSDHPPHADELTGWGSKLSAAQLAAESDDQSDHDQCLARLLSSPDPYRSTTPARTIGEMVAAVVGRLPGITEPSAMAEGLERCGIKVVRDRDVAGKDIALNEYRWLAVANSHQGLASIYADSHWKALSGTSGGWVRPLRRVTAMDRDGHLLKAQAYGTLRFAGTVCRCTLLPLEAALPSQLET